MLFFLRGTTWHKRFDLKRLENQIQIATKTSKRDVKSIKRREKFSLGLWEKKPQTEFLPTQFQAHYIFEV